MPGSYPFQAKATYAYTSEHDDDLHFDEKQVITVTAEEDEDWYFGEFKDSDGEMKQGIFPKNFVENLAPPRPRAKDTKAGKANERAEETSTMVSTKIEQPSSAEQAPAVAEPAEKQYIPEIASPRPINAVPAIIPEMKMSNRSEPPTDTAPSSEEPNIPKVGGSFRDRIAAFNIPEKAPIVPHSKPKPAPAKKPSLSSHSYVPPAPPTVSTQQRQKPSAPTLPSREIEEPVQEATQPLSSLKDRITKLQSTQLDPSVKKPKPLRRTQSIGSDADNPPGSPFAEDPQEEDSPFGLSHEAVAEEQLDASTEQSNRKSGEELKRQVSGVSSVSQENSHPSGHEEEASLSSEEEEVDPEVARRIALRERMAKMSGGMGMHLGFVMPGAAPHKTAAKKKQHEVQERVEEESSQARPVPVLPQINTSSLPKHPDEPGDGRSHTPTSAQPRSRTSSMASPPMVAPVPLPSRNPNSRAVPPVPPFSPPNRSSTMGTATSDRMESTSAYQEDLFHEDLDEDEASASEHRDSIDSPKLSRSSTLPITTSTNSQPRQTQAPSPPTSPALKKRISYVGGSGAMPPVPGAYATPVRNDNARAPPPLPTGPAPTLRNIEVERAPHQATSSISSTHSGGDHSSRGVGAEPSGPSSVSSDGEVTGYEADDDTDLASGVNHRDALVNADEVTEDDVSVSSPHPSRSIPPPPPSAIRPPHARIPSSTASTTTENPTGERLNRGVPPLPTLAGHHDGRRGQRQSTEDARPLVGTTMGRTSAEHHRPSMEHEYVAKDVDLSQDQTWWREPNMPPPVFLHRRNELIYEIDESSNTRRGGRTTVTRDIYVLFHDYSQTVVTVQYDRDDVASAKFEQRHEAPPKQVRKDDLEAAHKRFGRPLFDMAVKLQGTVIGDGEAFTFVSELFKSVPEALPPIGYDALGYVVFLNLANSSIQQHDEIRPGDIISFRTAKFQGHRGGLHQKYTMDVGKPSHVGIIQEWDGTKKKIRIMEQGRESKKVSSVSYKMGDLKSGEVKVWRVMPRGYVGWG